MEPLLQLHFKYEGILARDALDAAQAAEHVVAASIAVAHQPYKVCDRNTFYPLMRPVKVVKRRRELVARNGRNAVHPDCSLFEHLPLTSAMPRRTPSGSRPPRKYRIPRLNPGDTLSA